MAAQIGRWLRRASRPGMVPSGRFRFHRGYRQTTPRNWSGFRRRIVRIDHAGRARPSAHPPAEHRVRGGRYPRGHGRVARRPLGAGSGDGVRGGPRRDAGDRRSVRRVGGLVAAPPPPARLPGDALVRRRRAPDRAAPGRLRRRPPPVRPVRLHRRGGGPMRRDRGVRRSRDRAMARDRGRRSSGRGGDRDRRHATRVRAAKRAGDGSERAARRAPEGHAGGGIERWPSRLASAGECLVLADGRLGFLDPDHQPRGRDREAIRPRVSGAGARRPASEARGRASGPRCSA